MKFTLPLLAAALMLAAQPITAHAQNLFRTGRPDYARPAPANSLQPRNVQPRGVQPSAPPAYASNSSNDYWNRAWVSPQYNNASGDYERLQAAWENYRREALRYQGRQQPNDNRSFTANSSNRSYVPLGYATDWQPTSERGDSIRRSASREPIGALGTSSRGASGFGSGPDHQCEYRRRLENSGARNQDRYPEGRYDQSREQSRNQGRAYNGRSSSEADRRPTLAPSFRPSQYEESGSSPYSQQDQFRRSSQRRPLEPVPMSFSTERKRPSDNRLPSQLLDPARVASLSGRY